MRFRQPVVVAAGCAAFAVVLGLLVAGGRGPGAVDEAVRSAVDGWPRGVLVALLFPTEPYVPVSVAVLATLWCLRAGRQWDALFAVLAPLFAVGVNTWVAKPVFDRWKNDTLVYPSGHTVLMVATLVVVLVLVDGRARAVTAAVGVVLVACVAVGMVGVGYHYLTDVVGGAAFAVSAVLAVRGVLTLLGPPPVARASGNPVDGCAIVDPRE
jgi:membrane-associated phospholipid phosphatase